MSTTTPTTTDTIKKLTDREHILTRASMYLGAIVDTPKEMMLLQDNKFEFVTVSYNPGFLKIFEEILDNAVDEAIKNKFAIGTNIRIAYDTKCNQFVVEDDGRGLPQTIAHDNLPMAVIAFTEARAGSNFGDDKANGIGMNGVGSYLTNCYSKKFEVNTYNSKNEIYICSTNNAESYTYSSKKSTKRGTKVSFVPDLEKFGMTEVPEVYFKLIQNRCLHLAQCFPELKFKLELK